MKNLLLKSALVFTALVCGQAMAGSETAIRASASDTVITVREGRSVTIEFTGRLTDTVWLRSGAENFNKWTLQQLRGMAGQTSSTIRHRGGGIWWIRVSLPLGQEARNGDILILRSASGQAIDSDRIEVRR